MRAMILLTGLFLTAVAVKWVHESPVPRNWHCQNLSKSWESRGSFQSDNGVIEARWAEAYPGNVAPRFEGGSVYMHDGYLYDPTTRRHYDRDRGRWVTDVGSVPTHSVD